MGMTCSIQHDSIASFRLCVCVCACVSMCEYVCVCVPTERLFVCACVCVLEGECVSAEWLRQTEKQREQDNKSLCVCLLFHFSLNTSVHVSASQQDAARSVALSRMRSVAHGSVL